MKFKANIGAFVEACGQAKETIDKLSSNPLGNMYLRAAKKDDGDFLYCYSNNLTAQVLIKIPAEVEEEGKVLVHPGKIIDFLSLKPKEEQCSVVCDPEKGRLKVGYKRNNAQLGVMGKAAVATLESQLNEIPFTTAPMLTVKGRELAEFVRRGMFCIPSDANGQTAAAVGGMFVTDSEDGYEAQATDGSIAAQIRIQSEGASKFGGFMIPLAAMAPMNRLVAKRRDEDIQVIPGAAGAYGVSGIFFKFGDIIFGTVVLHGKFPNLKQVVNGIQVKHLMTVNREAMRQALGCCAAFATKSRTVRMEIKKDSIDMKVQGDTEDVMESVDVAHANGFDATLKIAVGLDYLINIASGSKADTLELGLTGPLNPLTVEDKEDPSIQTKYVLMPVRV